MKNEITDLITIHTDDGQEQLVDAIKTLLYKTAPEIFDLLDFYDDDGFLEPLVFAYYNSMQPTIGLSQILFGYMREESRPEAIAVFADEDGVVELPNIGYFVTSAPGRALTLIWNGGPEACVFKVEGLTVTHKCSPGFRIAGTAVQVCQFDNPLLKGFYVDEGGESSKVEVPNITHCHLGHLKTALEIIKEIIPDYYREILKVMRRIVIFRSEKPNSFATLSAHGTVFLNANEDHNEVFFLEDLIHQCGHVIFNALTFNKKDFLKIDPETPLQNFTNDDLESRTVYSAFHGIFTETFMTQALDLCYTRGVFSGHKEHELVGRLAYIVQRFNYDIRDLGQNSFYTEKGMLLYSWMVEVFNDEIQRRSAFLRKFDTSNQPYNFDYAKFLELNVLDDA